MSWGCGEADSAKGIRQHSPNRELSGHPVQHHPPTSVNKNWSPGWKIPTALPEWLERSGLVSIPGRQSWIQQPMSGLWNPIWHPYGIGWNHTSALHCASGSDRLSRAITKYHFSYSITRTDFLMRWLVCGCLSILGPPWFKHRPTGNITCAVWQDDKKKKKKAKKKKKRTEPLGVAAGSLQIRIPGPTHRASSRPTADPRAAWSRTIFRCLSRYAPRA